MSHPTDKHVGRRLRQVRVAQGMNQAALGELLGLSFQQVQKYESGSSRLSSARLWDLCQIFDLPVDYFFEGLDRALSRETGSRETGSRETGSRETGSRETGSGGASANRPMTRRTVLLAEAIDRLDDEVAKVHFLRLIEAFARSRQNRGAD